MPNLEVTSMSDGSARPERSTVLTPVQEGALAALLRMAAAQPVTVLHGGLGSGKTSVLRAFQRETGARMLSVADFLDPMKGRHQFSYDDIARRVVDDALNESDTVIIDDLDVVEMPTHTQQADIRPLLFGAAEGTLFARASALDKHIVSSRSLDLNHNNIMAQAIVVPMLDFDVADYAAIIHNCLGEAGAVRLEVRRIFQAAQHLNGHQLRNICRIIQAHGVAEPTTDYFIGVLERFALTGGVKSAAVEKVSFESLKGSGFIAEQLEKFVLLPMLQPKLAESLNLKPKRGVLLYGAPGTGKTSIGRALAHRMKGRFFLIDGTFVEQPASRFFNRVKRVFQEAAKYSPAVIFIDDADLLFKTNAVYGLNRFLLTKLDGLASEETAGVCVMMTAMNVQDIPQAILRSGRLDLWLECKLPDESTRAEILQGYTADLRVEWGTSGVPAIAAETAGFTPADLRRIVGDAKGLLAYDQVNHQPVQDFSVYLSSAIATVREVGKMVAIATSKQPPTLGEVLKAKYSLMANA
jgi:ATPase family protein associated with various cellular activities (AAA)